MSNSKNAIDKMAGVVLILTLCLINRTWSAPTTKPLEHSPSDLAWDAWLRQGSRQAPPPRRITTKSLFVFPQLGSEALPPCAEGYRPDAMNRCVKVVKVDETAHLEFLLQKLNSQFATETSGGGQDESYDYETETDAPDSTGPFQLNIPIALQVKGPKPDDQEGSGETALFLNKKTSLVPTSSPEVVPEYNSDKNQFFLDSAPAESQDVPRQNNSDTAGSVSILIRNTTNSGVTLLLSSNGKFENVTAHSSDEDLLEELEHIKYDSATNHDASGEIKDVIKKSPDNVIIGSLHNPENKTANIKQTDRVAVDKNILPVRTDLAPENLMLKNNKSQLLAPLNENFHAIKSSNGGVKIEHNFPEVIQTSHTLDKDNVSNAETLEDEIAFLKKDSALEVVPIKSDNQPSGHLEVKPYYTALQNIPEQTTRLNGPVYSGQEKPKFPRPNILPATDFELDKELGLLPSSNSQNDFEEKIKLISRFADVSRNTDPDELSFHKKPVQNSVKFPNPVANNVNEGLKISLLDTASINTAKFPFDTVKPQSPPLEGPIPYSPEYNDRNQPLQNVPKQRLPYWWIPYGWNVRNSAEELELMDFMSKAPSVQEYPFDVRLEHERHPSHYQTLYPGSHHSEGRLNVRHTDINHRRGRLNRKRQIQLEDLMNFKRGRHPHFRESGEKLDSQHAFDGR